jgi:hypothetical protein
MRTILSDEVFDAIVADGFALASGATISHFRSKSSGRDSTIRSNPPMRLANRAM